MTEGGSSNFAFLEAADDRLFRLATLAERYVFDDAPAALTKLRSFAEAMAKEIAATHALLPPGSPSFDEVLSQLRRRSLLPQQIGDIFHLLRRQGNKAVHDDAGTPSEALAALKLARNLAIWFHQAYNNRPGFRAGPFVPPASSQDISEELQIELAELRAQVKASRDAEAEARLAASDAETARREAMENADQREKERVFWEAYAAETEAKAIAAEQELSAIQKQAKASAPVQLDLLASMAAAAADSIDLDEKSTRFLIDEQLRNAGWEVDSALMRYARGARPEFGRNMAIAEWPTKSGPADYALFVDGACVGVIEAKRGTTDVPGRLGQAQRYARDIELDIDALPRRRLAPLALRAFHPAQAGKGPDLCALHPGEFSPTRVERYATIVVGPVEKDWPAIATEMERLAKGVVPGSVRIFLRVDKDVEWNPRANALVTKLESVFPGAITKLPSQQVAVWFGVTQREIRSPNLPEKERWCFPLIDSAVETALYAELERRCHPKSSASAKSADKALEERTERYSQWVAAAA